MNEVTIRLLRPHCINCGKREVRDSDGKKHYVRKVSTEILSSIAENDVNSLKSRLEGIIKPIVDEDI